MRIFKEEFNRKLRSFKEANQELSHVNIKQSEENTELRTRISKLKQQKTELEVTNRNLEEEGEKLRTDLDDVRRQKDQEIKQKNQIIMQQRDEYKAKELQFDELAGIKLQLDSEIELYRNILNEAEQASGYVSPLTTNNSNTGTRQSRKRKRVHMMTPMGNTPNGNYSFIKNNNNNDNSNNKENSNNGNVETPGIARAGKNAQNDLKHALQSDGSMVEDEEMKDHEEDCLMQNSYETPGNLEGARLQFSGLDLMKGMIELQNMSESPLSLNGYQLSNSCGYQLLDLPKDIILARGEKLRVYCGAEVSKRMNNEDLNIGYQGNYMFWNADVWTGKEKDCAKLQNPSGQVIAQIEISPDMVDMKLTNSKQGCLIM